MTGFYPPLPKVFTLKVNGEMYDIVDTRTNKVVEKVRHLKDALRTCELKNGACR